MAEFLLFVIKKRLHPHSVCGIYNVYSVKGYRYIAKEFETQDRVPFWRKQWIRLNF